MLARGTAQLRTHPPVYTHPVSLVHLCPTRSTRTQQCTLTLHVCVRRRRYLVLSGDTTIFPKIDELVNYRFSWLRLPRDRNCGGQPATSLRLVTHRKFCSSSPHTRLAGRHPAEYSMKNPTEQMYCLTSAGRFLGTDKEQNYVVAAGNIKTLASNVSIYGCLLGTGKLLHGQVPP